MFWLGSPLAISKHMLKGMGVDSSPYHSEWWSQVPSYRSWRVLFWRTCAPCGTLSGIATPWFGQHLNFSAPPPLDRGIGAKRSKVGDVWLNSNYGRCIRILRWYGIQKWCLGAKKWWELHLFSWKKTGRAWELAQRILFLSGVAAAAATIISHAWMCI